MRRDRHADAHRYADHSRRILPIGLTKLVTGEYTYAIFVVTVIALVLSWLVSVYLVPYLRTLLLKKPEHVVEKT